LPRLGGASLGRVTSYFRLHPDDDDPKDLLEPHKQVSKPWGSLELGKPCDKCGRTGQLEGFGECPTCKGTGKITDVERRGVSVFGEPDALFRYMLRRDGDMSNSVLVELEGEEADDVDFDADEGALLVFPRRIVNSVDIDWNHVDELRGQVAGEAA
jgi:hypothetical protein